MNTILSIRKFTAAARLFLAALLIVGFTLTARPGNVAAASLFVVDRTNDLMDIVPGDGHCDGVPEILEPGDQCSLRAAIMESNALPGADTIIVPAGTYKLTFPEDPFDNTDATGDFNIVDDLTIGGAGPGHTIIDGNGMARIFDFEAPAGSTLNISDLTLQHGFSQREGGAIYHNRGTLNLSNTALVASTAKSGGAIFSVNGIVTMAHTTISSNHTTQFSGGGIETAGTTNVTITDSRISGNSAKLNGGGISVDSATGIVTLKNSTVSGNTGVASGGGVANGGSLTLVGSTLSGNSTSGPGGGIYNIGAVNAVDSTLSGNKATGVGGGIFQNGGGGATLDSVTLAGNTSSSAGAGAYIQSGSTLSLANSIIALNLRAGVGDDCYGTLSSHGYNLVQKVTNCTVSGGGTSDIIGKNPLLGPLQDNGGPTQTRALLGGSPAVDAANPALPGSPDGCPLKDQRGISRLVDGNADNHLRCDIGAFEYAGPYITGISTVTKPAGSAGFTLTVTGVRFQANSVVTWKGANRTTTFVSATQLKALIPAGDLATAGVFGVAVVTPGTSGGISNGKAFTVTNPVPVVGSLSPASAKKGGAALTLTITGTGFVATSKVHWKGIARTTSYVSATTVKIQVTAADLAGAGTASVTVVNPAPGGGTSNAKVFTITL